MLLSLDKPHSLKRNFLIALGISEQIAGGRSVLTRRHRF